MCDGTRAVGRKREDIVRIQLTGEQDMVKIWAGYASEKAAVILTPELVFRLDPSDSGGSRGGKAGGGVPARNPAPAPAPASSVPTSPSPSPAPSPSAQAPSVAAPDL